MFGASAITIGILLVSFFVYRYISAQLEMKDLGGAYAAASMCFVNELMSGIIKEEELSEYLLVEESADVNAQSRHVLPLKLLNKAKVLNTRGRGLQDKTRSMVYSILVIVTLLIIASTWIKVFG